MLTSVGIPDGGIAQPASGRRLETAKTAASARERMNVPAIRMAFPFFRAGVARRSAPFNEFGDGMSAAARLRIAQNLIDN